MSNVKSLLKTARQALLDNDPENVIYLADKVIEDYDKDNFYAYLFKGKALTILEKYKEAMECYYQASKINPEDLASWKGMILIVKESDEVDTFFKVVTGYADALNKKGENLLEVANLITVYKTNFGAKVSDFEEKYLRYVFPGSQLGDLVGVMLDKPYNFVLRLATILRNREDALVKGSTRTFRMTTSRVLTDEQQSKLNAILWNIYKDSEVPTLYQQYINTCDDDDKRREIEVLLLKYEIECLSVSPPELKDQLKTEVFEMVSGMVVVKHPSKFAWDLYFDWCDYKSVSDLDLSTVADYIKLFGTTGLGSVFYAFILSEMSPFEIQKVRSYLKDEKSTKKQAKNKKKIAKAKLQVDEDEEDENEEGDSIEAEKLQEDKDQTESIDILSHDEIVDFLSEGLAEATTSILAYRIAVGYYIHLKEYEAAIKYSNTLLNMLRKTIVSTSHQFPNSKNDTFLSLAIGYTYHESPKNFPKALRLYDHVLSKHPDEVRAKVGKVLILIEADKYSEAELLLRDVVEEYPDNYEALLHYSWCRIQMNHFQDGRVGLQKVYDKLEGNSTSAYEMRASTLWKLGQSYLLELNHGLIEDPEHIKLSLKTAYDTFIKVLKQLSTYAPAYSSLGFIYMKYYNNKAKALKCFYKAFELDSAEVEAAKELVAEFSEKGDWPLVEIFCQRVIDSQSARRYLTGTDDDSWPFRMLGCVSLEGQDDAKAIEHFQNAVRINSGDIEAWLGLGEAYLSCGRLESAAKVFVHVIELDEEKWQAKYMLAVVQSLMGDYQESVYQLKTLSYSRPNESCILISLLDALIMKAENELSGGLLGRFLETALQAIDVVKTAVGIDKKSQKVWKGLVDVLRLLLRVESHLVKVPFELVLLIIDSVDDQSNSLIDSFPLEDGLRNEIILENAENGKVFDATTSLLILAARASLKCLTSTSARPLKAASVYNLGITYLESFKILNKVQYRDSSISILKKAIELESNTADFWVALGNASLTKNAKVSQHCFIRADSLAPKEPSIWTNLAVLYLHYDDAALAKDCFVKAQSIAPQYSASWAGQALIAEASGEKERSAQLFTHSLVVSNGADPSSMLLYGLSVLKKLIRNQSDIRMLDLVQEINVATFALLNYLRYHESDALALNITVSIIERINDFETGIKLSTKLCEVLEGIYEDSEDSNILVQYAKAKSQQARLYLGNKEYPEAVIASQTSLDLLGDTTEITPEIQRCILSSHTVMGLAYFFNNGFEEALEKFNLCLEIAPESERIVVTVAQLLYELKENQTSIDLLFENIEKLGSSLLIVLTLAAVAIVDGINDYFPAIKDELCRLPLSDLIKDSFHDVPFVISELNKRMSLDDANHKIWQRAAYLFPADVSIWKNLSDAVTLNVASKSKRIDSSTLSSAYVKSGDLREVQRALFLNPANVQGYQALHNCIQ